MREIRQSGSEGGVAGNGHPYPYLGAGSAQTDCSEIGPYLGAWSAHTDCSEIGPYQGGPRAASGGPKKTVSDGVKTNETCRFKNH